MKVKDFLYEEEESPVGRFDDYIISVYCEPLHDPSFHIRTVDWGKHCSYKIKDFNLLEKKTDKEFSSKELKEVRNWLMKVNKKIPDKTNWQVLVDNWNLNNDNYEISRDTKIPEM